MSFLLKWHGGSQVPIFCKNRLFTGCCGVKTLLFGCTQVSLFFSLSYRKQVVSCSFSLRLEEALRYM